MRADPVCALEEEMLMIRPHFAASMSGSTACVHTNMLFRLIDITRSQISSVISMKERKSVMPALFTKI